MRNDALARCSLENPIREASCGMGCSYWGTLRRVRSILGLQKLPSVHHVEFVVPVSRLVLEEF